MEELYQQFEIMEPTSDLQIKKWLLFNNIKDCAVTIRKEKSSKPYEINLLEYPQHWVFLDKKNNLLFDSYGSGPGIWYYDQYLPDYEPKFEYNIFQSLNTAVCGQYCCLYYLLQDNFVNYFTPIVCTPDTWEFVCKTPMNPIRMCNDAKCLNMWYKELNCNDEKNIIREEFLINKLT